VSYLDDLSRELERVGIPRRWRERIVAEAEDHLAEGDEARFGDPRELGRAFADDLAVSWSRGAAYRSFAALALAGTAYAAATLIQALVGWPDIASGAIVPLAVAAAIGMLLCPQIAFASGLLMLWRTWRGPLDAVVLRRARFALAFGAATLVSLALYAIEFRAGLPSWYWISVAAGAPAFAVPLAVAATSVRTAGAIHASAPPDFSPDLPLSPGKACAVLAIVVALAALVAGGVDEGPRNAIAEAVAVVACYLAFGRRLGIRR
jgi:hypothetical protein